jgi:hypothetical protein
MKKMPSDEYIEKAKLLDEDASERVLSRARSKLVRKLDDRILTPLDVVALQLEIEDEDLTEWRKKVAEIKLAESKKKPKTK